MSRCSSCSFFFALALLAGSAWSAPGLVLKHPDPAVSLSARWEWAFRSAAGRPFDGGYWTGYSIRRKMSEHSFVGSRNWPPKADEWTLGEILGGRRRPAADPRAAELSVKEAARRALDEIDGRSRPDRIVDKDIAVLLQFRLSSGSVPVGIEICDVQSLFDPQGAPLLWLGPASDPDSLALLDRFQAGPAGIKIKQEIIQAVGLHQTPGLALPFLERAAAPLSPEALRREAAEAFGGQAAPRAVLVLRRLVEEDRSIEVRKAAVAALAESEVSSALDALIETALKSPDKELRREAVEGLADKACARAVEVLGQAAFNDRDTEVQKEAVAALSDLPSPGTLSDLANLARTHPNPEVRKAAIAALGDRGGPEAIAVLADLARGKK